jgi:hypothetical protein
MSLNEIESAYTEVIQKLDDRLEKFDDTFDREQLINLTVEFMKYKLIKNLDE